MEAVRHGSRWLHEHPSEEQLKDWFTGQPLHDGMEHGPYMGGIVVIGAKEKVNTTAEKQNGETYVKEMERAVFVPYVKVDTRISYFWNLVKAMNDAGDTQYVGLIEPVPTTPITDQGSPYYNEHLPVGFGILPVRNQNDSISRFAICTQRVSIYELESDGTMHGVPSLQGIGTKQTPLARNWADDNALMKAETGAVGRALGMAGILVVGTGVATAEDMQEAAVGNTGPGASASAEPVLPDVVAPAPVAAPVGAQAPQAADVGEGITEPPTDEQTDEQLRALALDLQEAMEKECPQVWVAYKQWWKERKFGPIHELHGAALRGAVVKLQRDLDAHRQGTRKEPDPDAEV